MTQRATTSTAHAARTRALTRHARLQMGHGTRTDCVLAETFLRLDHLEDAIHAVKHEELINGMMMRMDHLATQIEHVQDHAGEKVEEAQKRADYKDSVRRAKCRMEQSAQV